ncbi:MAG: FGGY family carbohydrate kinase [Anaerolineaceae bacterium]|nr:FGGY family carbohydrate kinase [Anaerolineaceae bacterium]
MKDAILGIDIGTSSTKAILFDLSGKQVTSASQSYPLLTPEPGWAEQDPEAVWQALLHVLRDIVNQSNGCRILSMALAAQAGSIIPADLDGNPVYPMITWLDNRSQELMRQWYNDGTAATIRKLSGWQPFAGLPLPSIGWLRQQRPGVHASAKRFLGPADFLIHRLTGRFATDLSASSEMLLVDIKTGLWSEELCLIGGVNPDLQAEIGWAGRKVGEITREVSALTGLPSGTPVIAGGNDQPCAGLAMGMTAPGKVMLSTGTAWVLMSVVNADSTEAVPEWVNLYFHAAPERRIAGQLVGGFGATVDWWMKQTYQAAHAAEPTHPGRLYDYLNEAVASSPAGSRGLMFLSLSGPSQIMNATPGGGFIGMELAHTQADMSRAILEGCAFEVRWALNELGTAGIPVEELWLAGGANRSPVWPQILADVGGKPLQVASYADWAALGGAVLAGWGIGAFATLEEGITHLQPHLQRLEPNPALLDFYSERLAAYQNVSRAVNTARSAK